MVEAANICGNCKYFEPSSELLFVGMCSRHSIPTATFIVGDIDNMCNDSEYDEEEYNGD